MLTQLNNPLTQDNDSPANPDNDPRPRFAIGHLGMAASDVSSLATFYERLGMRLVVDMGRMAILELRGGTHVILSKGPAGNGSLDLIVDDIDETRAVMAEAGADPGSITRGNPHDRFTATDPEGNVLYVNSTHAIGPV